MHTPECSRDEKKCLLCGAAEDLFNACKEMIANITLDGEAQASLEEQYEMMERALAKAGEWQHYIPSD